MGKGGALRAGLNGRFNVGGRVSVFQILSRGSAARRVVAVGPVAHAGRYPGAAAQWLAAGRRIHFVQPAPRRERYGRLALLRVLVLPSVAVVAHRSWHAVSRYSARGRPRRLDDDNELGLRKASGPATRPVAGLLVRGGEVCQGRVGVKLCVYGRGGRPQQRRAALPCRQPHDSTHKCRRGSRQPRPVADQCWRRCDPRCRAALELSEPRATGVISVGSAYDAYFMGAIRAT